MKSYNIHNQYLGIISQCVRFLGAEFDGNVELQIEAAWILTNFVSGDAEFVDAFIECGGMKGLHRLLQEDSISTDITDQVIWALGNIAGTNSEYRDIASESTLDSIISVQNMMLLENTAWTLSNFCRGTPAPDIDSITKILKVFTELIDVEDEQILEDTCWGLVWLSKIEDTPIAVKIKDLMMNTGIAAKLIELASDSSNATVEPAIYACCNIIKNGDNEIIKLMVDKGFLPAAFRCLRIFHQTNTAKVIFITIRDILIAGEVVKETDDTFAAIVKECHGYLRRYFTWEACTEICEAMRSMFQL